MEQMLTTAEVAEYLRQPVSTVRYWRHRGHYGPKAVKVGRRVLYRTSDVEAWLRERFAESTGA